MGVALLDSGPIVAVLDRSDRWHQPCVRALKKLTKLVTVWPVLTEAMYLLDFSFEAQSALFEWMAADSVELLDLDAEDLTRMRALMKQYRDLPMDLADAALVRAAERTKITTIFTVDRKDFGVYRIGRRGIFQIIPE